MGRIVLILLLAGFLGASALGQDKEPGRKAPTDKMTLRMNTRDRMMISKGNSHQFRTQMRKVPVMKKGQHLHRRQMMIQQRHRRQQQFNQQNSRRAAQRQMMQQRRRPGSGPR